MSFGFIYPPQGITALSWVTSLGFCLHSSRFSNLVLLPLYLRGLPETAVKTGSPAPSLFFLVTGLDTSPFTLLDVPPISKESMMLHFQLYAPVKSPVSLKNACTHLFCRNIL